MLEQQQFSSPALRGMAFHTLVKQELAQMRLPELIFLNTAHPTRLSR